MAKTSGMVKQRLITTQWIIELETSLLHVWSPCNEGLTVCDLEFQEVGQAIVPPDTRGPWGTGTFAQSVRLRRCKS